jgi:hypothetical protein
LLRKEEPRVLHEKGPVRIHYEEGFRLPLLLIPGGGLNRTIAGLKGGNPFPAIEEFKGVPLHHGGPAQRHAGQSSGPLEVDRPWIRTPTTNSA